jgi:hypothetical protein
VTVAPTATSTPGSLHAARESKGQAVCNSIAGPYNAHLALLAELKDRSSVVAALAPSRLAKVLRDGVSSALDEYGPQLQPGTSALIANWLHQHVQLVERLTQLWNALSAGSASDVVRGFKAGFASPEAQAGTALGSLLGGVGGFAGGLVGTFLALHRDDQAFSSRLQTYLGEVDRWFTVAVADFDSRVLPRVERDLNPWPYRLRWTIGVVLALGAAGAAAWLTR